VDKTPGQMAYEAYRAHILAGHPQLAEYLQPWETLGIGSMAAWCAAAAAVQGAKAKAR